MKPIVAITPQGDTVNVETVEQGARVATARPLHEVAREIHANWGAKGNGVNFAALPYLNAMASMNSIGENYYADTGESIVAYFLCNAGSWRGEVARRIKKELKGLIA